jgi:hypothetical protein
MKASYSSLLVFVIVIVIAIAGCCVQVATAQQSSSASSNGADQAIIQAWDEASHPAEARIENDRLILPDDRDAACAFLRVYRMKRDIPGSDETRPAGYTTCVRSSQFTMKSSRGARGGDRSGK